MSLRHRAQHRALSLIAHARSGNMLPESIYVHANLKMPSSMSSCGVVPKKSPNSHPPFSLSFSCTKTTFRPAWTHQPSGQWMVVASARSSILPDGHED